MNTKEKLINKINSINDEQLLEEIMKLIELESDLTEIYKVSSAEKLAIEEGLADYNAGRVYSHSQANELIKEWLRKK